MTDQTSTTPNGLLCPTCRIDLLMSNRQGIEIDYCPKCRGVWLDRGELDKIIERSMVETPAAPQAANTAAPSFIPPAGAAGPWGAPATTPPQQPPQGYPQQGPGYDNHGYGSGHGGSYGGGHSSGHGGGGHGAGGHGGNYGSHGRRGFLGRIFD